MKFNDYTEKLLPSSPAHNYHSLDNNLNHPHHSHHPMNNTAKKEHEEEERTALKNILHSSLKMQRIPSEESVTMQHAQAISMTGGSVPTNTNVISALREKASKTNEPRVDNVFLYRNIPKLGDMFLDHKTSAITLLHTGCTILTIILIILALVLRIDSAWIYGTCLCLITNIFGVTHSMYSGSIVAKLNRLDAALQNFAVIIQKFAKALNIQEAFLGSVKHLLDFLDHHMLLIEYEHPEIAEILSDKNRDKINKDQDYKKLLSIYHELFRKIKEQSVIQHKKWLLTFFAQNKLLDNRFGITKVEYLDFIRKLPNKSRTFFQSLTGIHTRFKQLNISDELNQPPIVTDADADEDTHESKSMEEADLVEMFKTEKQMSIGVDIDRYKTTAVIGEELGDNKVLLYKDMTDLVYKVLADIENINKEIERELALKMLCFEREKEKKKAHDQLPFMLSKRMSVSLAHDAPNVIIAEHKMKKRLNKMIASSSTGAGDEYIKMENREDTITEEHESDEYHYEIKAEHLAAVEITEQKSAPLMNKITSYQGMDIVKQRTFSMDEEWLKKVMIDLNEDDDDNYYDYSHDHSHISNKL